MLTELTHLRNSRIHISGVMLMGIIHKLVNRTSSAYLAEIEAYYYEVSKEGYSYSQSGMRSYLKKLHKLGYISIGKDGLFCKYSLTPKGVRAIEPLKV